MPLLCFTCGMPLNNKQVAFDAQMDADVAPRAALDAQGLTRLCCRIVMNTSARAPQLEGRATAKPRKCAQLRSLPLIGGPVVTLSTDGSTAPLASVTAASADADTSASASASAHASA